MIFWPTKATKGVPKIFNTTLDNQTNFNRQIKYYFFREKKSPAVPTWLFLLVLNYK